MCSDIEFPLIAGTAKKPFLPGRQIFAIYKDHFVIAITRIKSEFPEAIYEADGATAWKTLPRTRKVSVIPFENVDWIKTYESGSQLEPSCTLTLSTKDINFRIKLDASYAREILTFLAERFSDKLDPKAETAGQAYRKMILFIIAICLLSDAMLAWTLYDLYTTQSITGPQILVDIIWLIYKNRGFATTATITICAAAFFNYILLVLSLAQPKIKNRTLNCNHCGYNLVGQTGSTCPECGENIS